PAAPARAGARCGRTRAGPAGRLQPRRLDLGAGVAGGAGGGPVPARPAGADGAGAGHGHSAGRAGIHRPRLARRADRCRPGRGLVARATGAPAAGRRRPSPGLERGRLRRRLRCAAGVAAVTDFFASCGKGLEYLLADELMALGCSGATGTVAGANAQGTLADAQRAVMWSRLASRVLWPLATFDCADEHALYAGAAVIDWPRHMDA